MEQAVVGSRRSRSQSRRNRNSSSNRRRGSSRRSSCRGSRSDSSSSRRRFRSSLCIVNAALASASTEPVSDRDEGGCGGTSCFVKLSSVVPAVSGGGNTKMLSSFLALRVYSLSQALQG